MCGIAGWIDWEANLSSQEQTMKNMANRLIPRGPDAEGIWLSSHAAFAHRRLIVVDPAGGAQPMIRRRGNETYVMVYNGELYNTNDLRSELEGRGHRFAGTSDTEVLLVSYIEWGKDCVHYLNGIFAFGIWREEKKDLFVARDRMGVKPFFFTAKDNRIIFGSEIKALLAHPDVKPEIKTEGLAEIFALGPGRTPGKGVFHGIEELLPGHCLYFSQQGWKTYPYWSLKSKPHEDDLDTTIETVRELVVDSIKRQLVADVPVATFLSGGLDSSAITGIAANTFAEEGRGPLHTFSVDYVDNDVHFRPNEFQPNPDAPFVKIMSDAFQTIHHGYFIDTPQLFESLKMATLARDLPGMTDVDSSLYLFCKEIKKSATVTLSGECADEVFGGYPWFHRKESLEATTFPWTRNVKDRIQFYSGELLEAIKPEEYVRQRYQEALAEVDPLPGENKQDARIREIFYLNLTRWMPVLLDRKDRMSMAVGLEVRVPFCDHRIVEYMWNVPWSMKTYNGREKGILRHSLRGILPDEIITRKKSPYPKTHNPSYLASVREGVLDLLSDANSPVLPFFDQKALRAFAERKDLGDLHMPWFGQLMNVPQFFAYVIQVNEWLKDYHIRII